MSENCGPEHNGCDCEEECPGCGGAVEETTHFCNCVRCEVNELEDDFRCVKCGDTNPPDDLNPAGTFHKAQEARQLASWKRWAAGAVSPAQGPPSRGARLSVTPAEAPS